MFKPSFGGSGSNPNKDAPCLEVEFDRFACNVVFPPAEQVEEYSKYVSQSNEPPLTDWTHIDPATMDNLMEIKAKDPLSELSEQDKDQLWKLRYICCKKIPDSLPKLLDAVKWNSRDEVSQLFQLLLLWPVVSPETALELLDCKYADPFVRKLAVR